jgi:curved DNA-binding protein CbpA
VKINFLNIYLDYMPNHYKILGVKQDATKEEITKAYRQLALKYHPDKHKKSEKEEMTIEEMEIKFQEINEANEILSDQEKRSKYDANVSSMLLYRNKDSMCYDKSPLTREDKERVAVVKFDRSFDKWEELSYGDLSKLFNFLVGFDKVKTVDCSGIKASPRFLNEMFARPDLRKTSLSFEERVENLIRTIKSLESVIPEGQRKKVEAKRKKVEAKILAAFEKGEMTDEKREQTEARILKDLEAGSRLMDALSHKLEGIIRNPETGIYTDAGQKIGTNEYIENILINANREFDIDANLMGIYIRPPLFDPLEITTLNLQGFEYVDGSDEFNFSILPNLSKLDISQTRDIYLPHLFTNCKTLSSLDISESIIYPIPEDGLPEIDSLTELNISKLKTTANSPVDLKYFFKSCKNLETIAMSGTEIKAIAQDDLPKLEKLTSINLEDSPIKGDDFIKILSACPNLEEINLINCKWLTAEHLEHISKKCPNIKTLMLGGCNGIIDGLDKADLAKMKSLNSIELPGGLSEDNLQKISDCCPNIDNDYRKGIGLPDPVYLPEKKPSLLKKIKDGVESFLGRAASILANLLRKVKKKSDNITTDHLNHEEEHAQQESQSKTPLAITNFAHNEPQVTAHESSSNHPHNDPHSNHEIHNLKQEQRSRVGAQPGL